MISAFICQCDEETVCDSFDIKREVDVRTNEVTRIYFECSECGREYSLEEVTQYK